jgi:hypothetical protein
MATGKPNSPAKDARHPQAIHSTRSILLSTLTPGNPILKHSLSGILLFLLLLTGSPHPAEANTDPRFGLIETYESPGDALQAGAGWTRIRFQWAEVQAAGPDTWTPAVSDQQIANEVEAGRLLVGMLIGIPDRARDADRQTLGL